MRRSVWRPLPRDPTMPLKWWWRESRWIVWSFSATGISLLCVLHLLGQGATSFTCLIALPLGLFLGYEPYRRQRERRFESASALVAVPAPVEAFPIEFVLSEGDVVTGRDQGIASFVEGWLHVEGLRASFSLRPIDTTRIGFSKGGFDRFDLPGGQSVELRPLSSGADRATFGETVRVWHRFPVFLAGEPLLPPAALHPSALSRPLTTLAIHLIFIPPLVAFCLYLGQWSVSAQVVPFLIVPAILLFRNTFVAALELRRLAVHGRQGFGPSEATDVA